jgi:transcriptional regulator with XRE-family HTH domain
MPTNETGKLIQELRIKAGFSQKTLAAALHITDKAISKWERGISLPEVSLLPKLSLLLDTDMELLIANSMELEEWVGLIDIHGTDFSQIVYDKPLVYYLLCHYILVGIKKIYILTDERNERYLKSDLMQSFGLEFIFDTPKDKNMMIMDHPWFLFGSNLTKQFQGAMLSHRMVKLVPHNQEAVFYFATNRDCGLYFRDKKKFRKAVSEKPLGRGMVCLDMDDYDKVLDVAGFIRTYQRNSGLLIGDIEEMAYKKGFISKETLLLLAESVPYGDLLRNVVGKPTVG